MTTRNYWPDDNTHSKEIKTHLASFEQETRVKGTSSSSQMAALLYGLEVARWLVKKIQIQFRPGPRNFFHRDIFSCELGYNIGSEESYKRPVVIIQNNLHNRFGNTVLVVPITTYGNKFKRRDDGTAHLEWLDKDDNTRSRELEPYEVPIEIEAGPRIVVDGCANVSMIRSIDKRRLEGVYMARVTTGSMARIRQAFIDFIQESVPQRP